MANIVQRLVKGSPLTLQEHDNNFNNLNTELGQKATPASVDIQINAAVAIESAARASGDTAEVSARNSALATGDAATLVSAKAYSDGVITTEVTNRNSAVTAAVAGLKGGVATDGDTLGKLRALITGSNSGTNTGDETNATILAKLGATVVTGSNTGDQTNITGNAGTASKLASAHTINGVAFDGTTNITINAIDATARVASSLLGAANGVATLDSTGLVLASQLPSYIDDVLEGANLAAFPAVGETAKIYVALDTNKTYRWSGSAYVYITSGAVDSVAGKTGIVSLVKADVGLANVDNTADSAKPVSTAQATANTNVQSNAASDATTKANAAQAAAIAASAPVGHVGSVGAAHGIATTATAGFLSAADKTKLDGVATGATANLGTVTAVTGTGAISSTGGTTPVISINLASNLSDGALSAADKSKLDGVSGSNTGDETNASIKTKLGITTISGSNTGDETNATIKSKLSITTLSGSNTGDQTTVTGNAGSATVLATPRNINGVAFNGSADITINAVDATARVASSLLGVANGVATLDASGTIPVVQLPSYVDDIIEAANLAAFPVTGVTGKIYVALDTNKTYRWSGSVYVYITSGAVDSVAGKTGVVALVKADVGLGSVDNTADTAKPVSAAQATAVAAAQAAAIAASAPVAHVGSTGAAHGVVTTTVNGFMIAADKSKLDGVASGATANLGTVTAVTGTGAIVSSGGTTPAISIVAATTAVPGTMSAADKTKLDGVATGAQVNVATNLSLGTQTATTAVLSSSTGTGVTLSDATTTVAGLLNSTDKTKLNATTGTNTGDETGATIKTKLSIATLSGNNTGDQTTITGNAGTATKLAAPVNINGVAFDGSAAITVNAVDATARVASSLLGVANGVATLDATGLVPSTQLPSYVDDVLEGANLAAFPASGVAGKIYVALDTNKTYRWSGSAYVYITSGAVDSVAGKTGVVTLVSSDVGLGSVNNTADTAKPVSTAQQTALNLKADLAGPTFTGVPAAPTAAVNTNTTQIATTAFVQAEIANDAAPLAHVGSGAAAHAAVTTTVNGFMIAADKSKLDGIASGATANVGTVTAVTGTGAISSTGGTTPVISIAAATTAVPGTLSAADKTKLDGITGTNTGDETLATIKTKLGVTTLSGSNTGDQTNITGNAATATALTGFTNSSSGNPIVGPDSAVNNGIGYVTGVSLFGQTDGALFTQAHSAPYESQIYQDYRTGQIALRGKNVNVWTGWRTVWDNTNLTNLSQLTNGPGYITGTGNAATATKLATARTINGVAFDGTANISIAASSASSLTGPANCTGTDGWFRSSGACGWYSSDYAVGIYATEAGNVRTYNSANFIAGGNVTAYSDERLKKEWVDLPQTFLQNLSEVKYGTYTRIDTDARQVGVSAQELQKVLPEAVMGTGEGEDYLSVAYGNAALVAAVELSKEVIRLNKVIADQESRLQKLEALLVK